MPKYNEHLWYREVVSDEPIKNEKGVLLTPELMIGYDDYLDDNGRVQGTREMYLRGLNILYTDLPDEKRITTDVLQQWRSQKLEAGYNASTINVYVGGINGYLVFVGAPEYQLTERLKKVPSRSVEITRYEYLRLLSAARLVGREKLYLLIKIFANTGLPLHEAEKVTVEAVSAQKIEYSFNKVIHEVYLPKCISDELLAYAERKGIQSGPILLTRTGKPMERGNITMSISYLAQQAQVDEEKCNPRCLRKLYLTTMEEVERRIALLRVKELEQMAEEEQRMIGWENN